MTVPTYDFTFLNLVSQYFERAYAVHLVTDTELLFESRKMVEIHDIVRILDTAIGARS